MADEDKSPLHRKKPCRACRDFKSWMNQGDRNKSTMVRSLDHHKIKRIRAITYLKEEHHHDVKENIMLHHLGYIIITHAQMLFDCPKF